MVVDTIEIETWLNRQAIERSADSLAFDLERPRWQRYPLDWSHALELNSPNDLQELNRIFGKVARLLAPDHERSDDFVCAYQRHNKARNAGLIYQLTRRDA